MVVIGTLLKASWVQSYVQSSHTTHNLSIIYVHNSMFFLATIFCAKCHVVHLSECACSHIAYLVLASFIFLVASILKIKDGKLKTLI